MCNCKKHYLPAIPPSDYKGPLDKWTRQLRKMGAFKGRLPKDKLPLRRIWIEEMDYLKILDACEDRLTVVL
ncbi:MAG: hypothetical protein WC906_04535 [Parcubacteria group bacterium]|jgi:hypothetical protein